MLCAATAAAQYGLITLTQARACGLSAQAIQRRITTGKWEIVLPRIYRIAGTPCSWHQSLMAATLWAGEGSAVSYRSAGALWRLGGYPADLVEISTTGRVRKRPPGIIVHRPRRLLSGEITRIDGIPVTTPARTLIDLCATRRAGRAERALDEVLRRRLTYLDELRNYLRLEARRGRPGVTLMRALLDARNPGYVPPDSELERDLEKLIIGSNRLPTPVRQYPVFEDKRLMRVFDLAYPEALLGIEAQSWQHHGGRIEWSKDQTKDNAAAPLGWLTLRYTRFDVDERPAEVVDEIWRTRLARLTLLSRTNAE